MKVQSVLLCIFLMIFTVKSSAGTVEAAQWIPWSFVADEMKKLPLAFRSQQANLSLKIQEWTPKATTADFQLAGRLSELHFSSQGIQAVAQNLSARLAIGGLAIDQVITREINGNIINIRVQALCQPFEVQIPQFAMAVNLDFAAQGHYYAPHLTQLRLQIPQNSWALSPIVCQGPAGLDQKLVMLIQEKLSQPAAFQDLIREWMAPHLDQLVQKSWNSLTQEAWQNLKVASMSQPSDKGFHLIGQMEISGSTLVRLPTRLTDIEVSETAPQLILSNDGFSALAKENLASYNFNKFNIQQISGFKKLMQNRFIQLFVWPDLIRFSRSAPFYLSTDPAKTDLQLKALSSGQWQLQLQTGGVLQAEKRGAVHDYLHWGVGMASTLETQVKDSRLILTTKNSKSRFNWGFDQKYIERFNPSTWISNAVFEEAGKALFQNRSIEKELPTLNWQGRTFKLNGWNQKNDVILIDWKE